jgi:transposase
MIPVASGVRVWLATGHTDMRKGFDGLALLVQEALQRNPHNGHAGATCAAARDLAPSDAAPVAA